MQGENPARDSAINPKAAEAQKTYAYSLEEINAILGLVPEPAATSFAVAFMGLRHGEIQGVTVGELPWRGTVRCSLHLERARLGSQDSQGGAPVPVIRQLADRLEMHRLRSGNPEAGPILANGVGNPLALNIVVNRIILPALNRCEVAVRCGRAIAWVSIA